MNNSSKSQYHFTSIRIAMAKKKKKGKKTEDNSIVKMWRNWNSCALLREI